MSKHTPGPWNLASDGQVWAATEHGFYPICQCEDFDEDARLIAAAPDLLEACRAAYAALLVHDGPSYEELESLLGRAIRKATGEEIP